MTRKVYCVTSTLKLFAERAKVAKRRRFLKAKNILSTDNGIRFMIINSTPSSGENKFIRPSGLWSHGVWSHV